MPDLATIPGWVVGGVIGGVIAIVGLIFWAGNWYGVVNSDRKSFKEFMEAIRGDIQELRQDIKDLLRWQDSPTVVSKSPLRLSEMGQKVSDDLDMPTMARSLAESVKGMVKGMEPYDIQEFCFEYIRGKYEPSAADDARIKQWAYENGVDRDDVLDALAIVLRDELLQEANESAQ